MRSPRTPLGFVAGTWAVSISLPYYYHSRFDERGFGREMHSLWKHGETERRLHAARRATLASYRMSTTLYGTLDERFLAPLLRR